MTEITLDEIVLHDLKNPLSGITGNIGLFNDGLLGPLTAEQQARLIDIESSARKLSTMLSDLQAINFFEKKELEPTLETFTAHQLLKELEWLPALAAKEEKSLNISVDQNLTFKADLPMITRILCNLLLNAIKQTPRGGQIACAIKREKGQILFEVIDQGDPLPEKLASETFNKEFKTLHPELRSRIAPALGFYFCKLAVEAHGGRISMTTRSGQGSSYSFLLPQQ